MRVPRLLYGSLTCAAVLVVVSGCWKGSLPGDGDPPGAFTCTDDSDRTTDDRHSDHRFVGTWNWLSSCGGIAGSCMTPETAGFEERLHLSWRGSYTRCRDTDTVEEGLYLIELRDDRNRIHFVNPDFDTLRSLYIEHVSRDTLLLDEGCCDMFAHLYARQ